MHARQEFAERQREEGIQSQRLLWLVVDFGICACNLLAVSTASGLRSRTWSQSRHLPHGPPNLPRELYLGFRHGIMPRYSAERPIWEGIGVPNPETPWLHLIIHRHREQKSFVARLGDAPGFCREEVVLTIYHQHGQSSRKIEIVALELDTPQITCSQRRTQTGVMFRDLFPPLLPVHNRTMHLEYLEISQIGVCPPC